MISEEDLKEIEDLVQEFFQKTDLNMAITVGKFQDSTIPVDLEMDTPQILIGEGGQTLIEIQRLLKLVLKKKINQPFYVDLDINNYKKKKIEYLKEIARSAADEVILLKETKELAPMSAYERRIIHMELAARPDVTSESLGEDSERRVAVKPYPIIQS